MPKRYDYVHEAVAVAVRRRFLMLTVESTSPVGDINGYELDLKGGTKEQRDKAMEFAKRFAEGLGAPADAVKMLRRWPVTGLLAHARR